MYEFLVNSEPQSLQARNRINPEPSPAKTVNPQRPTNSSAKAKNIVGHGQNSSAKAKKIVGKAISAFRFGFRLMCITVVGLRVRDLGLRPWGFALRVSALGPWDCSLRVSPLGFRRRPSPKNRRPRLKSSRPWQTNCFV